MGKKKESDTAILREIAVASAPVVTAPELTESLAYSRDGIRKRLMELESDGYVKSRTVGANAVVWWITDKGWEYMNS